MKEEVPQISVNQIQKPKTSKKKTIIIFIIVISIILIYFLARFFLMLYIINSAKAEMISSTFLQIAQERQGEQITRKNITSLEEAKQIINKNKDYSNKLITTISSTGSGTAVLKETIHHCKDGTSLNSKDYEIDRKRCNNGGSNNTSYTEEYVHITTNKSSYWISSLLGDSLRIFLEEDMLGLLEYEFEDINSEKISALTLTTILSIADTTIIWAGMIPVIQDIYNDNGLEDFNPDVPPIEKDLKIEIPKMKKFAEDLPMPTKEQINNIEIVDSCLESMKGTSKTSQMGHPLRKSLWDLIFFTKTNKGICKEIEGYRKRQMLRLLTRMESETHPFTLFLGKTTLNRFAECPWGWGENECFEEFTKKFQDEIRLALAP